MQISITSRAYAAIREHCNKRELEVEDWASRTLHREATEVRPVEPRRRPEMLDPTIDLMVWRRPPFWARG